MVPMHPLRRAACGLVLVSAGCFATAAQAEWFQREAAIMGTRIAVELWAEDADAGEEAIEAVLSEMRRVDALMSHYKPDSELSRINQGAALGPVQVAPELSALIERALQLSRLTDGAFDITYASVGYLYDYRRHVRPSESQIESGLGAVNWHLVEVDREASTVRFARDGVRIDLGGIAKGYAVDQAIGQLRSRGIAHAIVTAGGDSRIIGDRFGRPWIVGIRHPDDADRVIVRMPVVDEAVSTSGDYERYFDEGGARYHHIIDPRTGRSAGEVRSVTLIGPDATTTDGLSTSVFVLGPERGLELVGRMAGIDAVIVRRDGKVLYSPGLAPPPAAGGLPAQNQPEK
jgi:thiamine biosynthesis lipoprotein